MRLAKAIPLMLMTLTLPVSIGCGTMGGKTPPPEQPVARPVGVETPEDAALSKAVKQRLSAEKAVNLSPVVVEARKGTVYLSGRVSSLEAREHATKIAWQVAGVQTVLNHLEVGE